jgi:exonuclease SbcD
VSGNHDSGERLGYLADFTAAAGVHIATRIDSLGTPVILRDEHGPVFFYGIPFIEPVLARRWFPDADLRTQEDAIRLAVDGIRARHPAGERSVILAHTFVSPGAVSPGGGSDGPEAGDAPRDFTQGGVDVVPVDLFTQFTYAALGHIHGRSRLTPNVRYSGSPLAYSFTDAGKPRGAWLVDLDAIGLADVRWVDLPIPRSLAVLSGTLDDLLADPAHASAQECWMRAILTDQTRPMEAMNRLRSRFPYCVQIEYRPAVIHDDGHATYGTRVAARTDEEIIAAFLELVRNGEGPSEQERALVADLVAEQRAEASR